MARVEDITAGIMQLVNNAVPTAWIYYSGMADKFDEKYGKGWSEKHPEIVAKMATVAAQDFYTMYLCQNIQRLADDIKTGIENLQD